MKICNFFAFIYIIIFLSSCFSQEDRKEYYPDGKVKYSYHSKGGLQDGLSIAYYNTGIVKSRTMWKNGKQDGEARYYYPSGKLKKLDNWKLDLANGLLETFYESGKLEKKRFFVNGNVVGWSYIYSENGYLKTKFLTQLESGNRIAIIYDEHGKPKEKHIERKDGSLIYVAGYDTNGKLEAGIVLPYYYRNNYANSTEIAMDTIKGDEIYNVSMRFYLEFNKNTKLVISSSGKFDKNVDTLSMVHFPKSESFEIKRRALKAGENFVFYKFICLDCLSDTLSVDGLSGSHSFFSKQ